MTLTSVIPPPPGAHAERRIPCQNTREQWFLLRVIPISRISSFYFMKI